MNHRIEDILDDSLAAMLDGGESAADCLRRHPEAAAELQPLLGLAARGQQVLQTAMPAGARQAARERIMIQARAATDSPGARRLWPGFWPRRLAARSLIIAGAVMLLGAGTAFAASKAGPDSFLFSVRKELESARSAIAWQNLDRAAVEVGYANQHLDEIEAMADSGQYVLLPGALDHYQEHIDSARTLVDQARSQGDDTGEVEAMIAATLARQRQVLEEMEDRLPEDVRTAIGRYLEAEGDDAHEAGESRDSGLPAVPSALPPASPGRYYDDDDDIYYPPGGGDDTYHPGGSDSESSGDDDYYHDGHEEDDDEDHPVGSMAPGDDDDDD